jgi:phenol 2-monooxygenase
MSEEIPIRVSIPVIDPQHVDVFICGSGSAGICTATWLARYGISCKIVDWRPGPLEVGQADGVQCRTVEVFDSFGVAEELLREAYHVLEVTFWSDDGKGGILRASRSPDRDEGVSHMPHVILNQARVNGLLLDAMRRFNGQKVDYNYTVNSVSVDSEAAIDPNAYCVTVNTTRHGVDEVFKAKYALVCSPQALQNIFLTRDRHVMVLIALYVSLLDSK